MAAAPVSRRFERPGPGTYVFLLLALGLSLFPLYWSLVVASHDGRIRHAFAHRLNLARGSVQ